MKKRILSLALALCLILTVGAVGANANESNSVLNQTTGITYDTLTAALAAASSGQTIYVTKDYTLESTVSIPSGVTVIVPSSSSLNDSRSGNNSSGAVTSGSAYVTLTIPSGVMMYVYGTLIVAGNQQSTTPRTGCRTGNYGAIDLSGSVMVMQYGSLYARGLISGSGNVYAMNGSNVYQLLQIYDWRGGTKTLSAYNAGVFPFNCYSISNITANAMYFSGATLYGQYYVVAAGAQTSSSVTIIGTDGLLQLNSGNISTSYSSGRLTATINGVATTGDIGVNVSLFIFSYNFSSSGLQLPFGYNMDVIIPSDCSLTIANSIKLLPGCTFTNNGTLNVTGNLYVYGTNYSSTYNYAGWSSSSAATITGSNTPTGTIYSSTGSGTAATTIKEYVQSSGVTTVSFY